MEVEFHQLDLRYEALRRRNPQKERRLLASLGEIGQQVPIVVIRSEAQQLTVIDGYKRVRALKRLKQDTVRATTWELDEADALLLERAIRTAETEGSLEQGWVLREIRNSSGLSLTELAKRFDKSVSWVSRRLSLVTDLPSEIQELVRRGEILGHIATKYLVPLARAKQTDAIKLSKNIAGKSISTRQMMEWYSAYTAGNTETRRLLIEEPLLFFRAKEEAKRKPIFTEAAAQIILKDVGMLGGVARRVRSHFRQGLARQLLPPEREEIQRCLAKTQEETQQLFIEGERELSHVG